MLNDKIIPTETTLEVQQNKNKWEGRSSYFYFALTLSRPKRMEKIV